MTLFAYSFLNAAKFVLFDCDGKAYWVERMSVTGKIAEATATAGVFTHGFDLLYKVACFPIEALCD